MFVEPVWKVARYTTAAPVYFTECDNYVDGGVKANNPSAFGLTEIQSFLSWYVMSVLIILVYLCDVSHWGDSLALAIALWSVQGHVQW